MKKLLHLLLILTVPLCTLAQQKTVTGRVTDSLDAPLRGVTIQTIGNNGKQQSIGVTKESGEYSVTIPANVDRLVFSFTGMQPKTEAINGRAVINVSLTISQSLSQMSEVVVVGYGTQKRVNLSGAVGTVSAADIRKNVNDNTINNVVGRTPGVRVTQLSSQPGMYSGTQSASSSIDIRGFASYQSDGITPTQRGGPLFVIDGIPTTDASQFARLDANEIESFSVLKDATAAIYGMKASNGVIVVTTRHGAKGRIKVDYAGNIGVNVITKYPKLADAAGYALLWDENQINGMLSGRSNPITPTYSAQQIQQYADGTLPNVDWIGQLFKNSSTQNQHNLTITGGSDRIQSFTTLSYFQQGGVMASGIDGDRKYNLRQVVDATVAKGLTANLNLGFNNVYYTTANTSTATLWSSLVKAATGGIPPIMPVYANNDPKYYYQFPSTVTQNANIAALINKKLAGYNSNNSRMYNASFTLNYQLPFLKGLSAKGFYAYQNSTAENYNYAKSFNLYTFTNNAFVPTIRNAPSTLSESYNSGVINDLQVSLNYDKVVGKHHLNLLGLYEQTYYLNHNINAGIQYTVDLIPTLSAGNGITATNGGTKTANANNSYVGKLTYEYNNRYILDAGFREQGSSLFGPGNQWGFFPYGSAAWRISEEDFIKDHADWIDNLKVRGSYGLTGDDAPASGSTSFPLWQTGYSYPATGSIFANGNSNIGTVFGNGGITKGVNWTSVAAADLSWYTSKQLDIGIEASFWDGKLTFEGDIFRRTRDGLLGTPLVAVPTTFGANIPAQNINSDQTQGWEVQFGHTSNWGQTRIHISANAGYSRTKLLHWEETTPTGPYDVYRNKYTNRFVDQIWGYTITGQFQSFDEIYSAPIQDGTGNRTLLPGDYRYKDLNGDNIINGYDQKVIAIGGNRPLVYFGSSFDITWKGLSVSLLLQGATAYHISYQDQMGRPFFNNADPLTMYLDRWHLANVFDPTSAWVPGKYPAMGQRSNYMGIGFQTINSGAGTSQYVINGNTENVYDATYIRLKQMQISYTLPRAWYTRLNLSSVGVVATGYNLLTWTKTGLKNFDPEFSNQNLYGYNYPITANFNFGIRVTF